MIIDKEDAAFKKALEDSKLDKFREWDGLAMQLALSVAWYVPIPMPEEGVVDEEVKEELSWNPLLAGGSVLIVDVDHARHAGVCVNP
jgi:hypothetical protein